MTKYKFIQEHESHNGNKTVTTTEVEAESIEDIVDAFKSFLLGCGFTEKTVNEYLDVE